MTPENFCYWLQGRAEMQPDPPPTEAEWKMIKEHLGYVFEHMAKPAAVVAPSEPRPPKQRTVRTVRPGLDVNQIVKDLAKQNDRQHWATDRPSNIKVGRLIC
jgi:hypothetical protein